jgi:hypothetical protein
LPAPAGEVSALVEIVGCGHCCCQVKTKKIKDTFDPTLVPRLDTVLSGSFGFHEPGLRDAEEVLTRLISVLNAQDYLEPLERLKEGHGLRVVK